MPSDHDYWKLSGKNDGVKNVTGDSEEYEEITINQRHSNIYEVISHHKGEASDVNSSSFTTDFSKVLGSLKKRAWLTEPGFLCPSTLSTSPL